jgi:hypothetical protein
MQIINKYWVLIFVTLLFSCDGMSNKTDDRIIGDSKALVLTPDKVKKSESFTLSFPKEHPKSIAIRTPGGVWYTIHDKEENIFVTTNKEFQNATSIQLVVTDVKGIKWENGKRVVESVFTEPGEYLVYMADNLETEPENTFFLSKYITIY